MNDFIFFRIKGEKYESTEKKHNEIINLYHSLEERAGEYAPFLAKAFYYKKIKEITGYCSRSVKRIMSEYIKSKSRK